MSDNDILSAPARVLVSLYPDACRDEIAGDLIEEAKSSGHSRHWITVELGRSLPGVFVLHFRQQEDEGMKHAKWIAAIAIVVVGALQAWDSGILTAPFWIGAMVVVAIALGIVGLFIQNEAVRLSLAVIVLALLFAARLASPVRLPELTLAGLPIFLILVLGPRFFGLKKEGNQPRGPGATA